MLSLFFRLTAANIKEDQSPIAHSPGLLYNNYLFWL